MPNKKKYYSSEIVIIAIIVSVIFGFMAGGLGGFWGSQLIRQPFNNANNANISQTLQVEEESATIDAVEKVSPAVVSIIISKDLSKYYSQSGPNIFPFDDFFDFGFPFGFSQPNLPEGKQEVGGGTGFIISSDGIILTNKHVVSDNKAEYTVLMSDGKKYDAKVLGTDLTNDIAVVKIDAKDLPVVELGDSDSLKIGQTVIAIGYALGEYNNTVTKGVISGLNRSIIAGDNQGSSEKLEGIIQTDAAINPGNSGGPLINLSGQVIGINTAINREGQLIGFAIPINTAKSVIDSVTKYGRIIRPYLGVRYIPITKSLAEKNNLPVDYGILIVRGENIDELAITPGSPADKAGLTENDIILEVNGVKLDESHSLAKEIAKYKPGDQVTLKILHDGQEQEITVTLEEYQP